MLFNLGIALFVIFGKPALAETSRFFANAEIQRQYPLAFALQPEAFGFVQIFDRVSATERQKLAQAILHDAELNQAIQNWEQLTVYEQVPFLRKIFALEVQILGIHPPELIIEDGITQGPAFFDFDPDHPSPGRVLLNPVALAQEKSKFASLSLLLHETRHSYQFQLAYQTDLLDPGLADALILKDGYRAAFQAQKLLSQKLSFCDFLTLLNEYEAFHFGNDIIRLLTKGKVDLIGMGTFASQFYPDGKLKIDLFQLIDQAKNTPQNVLIEFNILEQLQLDLLKAEQ
jgi:hypothetical protein